jgi:hypothetical protein
MASIKMIWELKKMSSVEDSTDKNKNTTYLSFSRSLECENIEAKLAPKIEISVTITKPLFNSKNKLLINANIAL